MFPERSAKGMSSLLCPWRFIYSKHLQYCGPFNTMCFMCQKICPVSSENDLGSENLFSLLTLVFSLQATGYLLNIYLPSCSTPGRTAKLFA